jgi:hypothetical protein
VPQRTAAEAADHLNPEMGDEVQSLWWHQSSRTDWQPVHRSKHSPFDCETKTIKRGGPAKGSQRTETGPQPSEAGDRPIKNKKETLTVRSTTTMFAERAGTGPICSQTMRHNILAAASARGTASASSRLTIARASATSAAAPGLTRRRRVFVIAFRVSFGVFGPVFFQRLAHTVADCGFGF